MSQTPKFSGSHKDLFYQSFRRDFGLEPSDAKTMFATVIENDTLHPVPVVQIDSTTDIKINEYNAVTSIASATPTTIVSYTVPTGKTMLLKLIEASGSNVAEFEVLIDAISEAKKRSYFTEYNTEFNFNSYEVAAGSIITLRVEHNRPSIGDFEGRINGSLI